MGDLLIFVDDITMRWTLRVARGVTLGVRGVIIDCPGRVFLVKHSYTAG